MQKELNRQLKRLQQREARLLAKHSKPHKIPDVRLPIPAGLSDTLEKAFYQGFRLIFGKGTSILEKTFDKEQLLLDHELYALGFSKKPSRKNLSRVLHQSNSSTHLNRAAAAMEGTALGLLGIGLPDIPIFIGMLLKTVYEISLSFGFSYELPEEQSYLLLLIETALTRPETIVERNAQVDAAAFRLNRKEPISSDLEQQMRAASRALSSEMLTMKFLQGLPVIGGIGGISNFICHKKIIDYVRLKYEKRFLLLQQL